jgi:phosphate transport system permease protein
MLVRLVRIAVNNLAGVPSIVFGVFGLGFFVYAVGGSLDLLFFGDQLPAPTLGTPGMLWAALTMALLTLPVVVVTTEEGLARVPQTLREGSFALGATRAETLLRVILPAASPALLTGLILAIARATGEVAPLLLVGVAKYAPGLPVDGQFPYLHLDRQFMHLGFYIYDLGFQSPDLVTSEGLVYATALLLVLIVLGLNTAAVMLRGRLRESFRPDETL